MSTAFVDKVDYFGMDCNDPVVCAYYVGVHAISEDDYNKMKKAFFRRDTDLPAERRYNSADIDTTKDCITESIEFDFHEADISTNDDIAVVYPLMKRVKFSVHLFRGIKNRFNPDYFDFTKILTVKNGIIESSVAFQVIVVDQGVEKVAYRGDLTNMFP